MFETSNAFGPMNPVSEDDGEKLGNICEQQNGVESFIVAGFTTFDAKRVFEVDSALFDDCPDFVDVLPFLSTPNNAGISADVSRQSNLKEATKAEVI